MAKKPTQQTKSDAPASDAPDNLPEPLEDQVDPVIVADAPQEPDEAPGRQDRQRTAPDAYESKRDEIARRSREIRAAKMEPEVEEAEEVEVEAAGEPEPEPEPAGPRFVELKVDGKVVTKKWDDVVAIASMHGDDMSDRNEESIKRLAQQNLAVNNRLETANRLLDETRAKTAQPADQPGPSDPADQPGAGRSKADDPDGSSQDQTNVLSDDDLRDIVEKFQLGDPDEAAEAAKRLISAKLGNEAGGLKPDQVRQIVREALVETQQKSEIDTALDAFKRDNADLLDDEDSRGLVFSALRREMRKDIVASGVLTEQQLAELDNNPQHINAVHSTLKQNGADVRAHASLLNAAATTVRTKFNLPKAEVPADQSRNQNRDTLKDPVQDRTARKRAVQQQPRASGGRDSQPGKQAKPPSTTREAKRSIIHEMRANRGFTTAQ